MVSAMGDFLVILWYAGPGLVGLVGAWMLAFPKGAWVLAKLQSQSRGLATTDAPSPGALRVLRIKGLVMLVFCIVFIVLVHNFRAQWR